MYNRERKTLEPTDEFGRPCVRELTIVIVVTPSSSVYPQCHNFHERQEQKSAKRFVALSHTSRRNERDGTLLPTTPPPPPFHLLFCFFLAALQFPYDHFFLFPSLLEHFLGTRVLLLLLSFRRWLVDFVWVFLLPFFGVFVMGGKRSSCATISSPDTRLLSCVFVSCPLSLTFFFRSTPLLGSPSR